MPNVFLLGLLFIYTSFSSLLQRAEAQMDSQEPLQFTPRFSIWLPSLFLIDSFLHLAGGYLAQFPASARSLSPRNILVQQKQAGCPQGGAYLPSSSGWVLQTDADGACGARSPRCPRARTRVTPGDAEERLEQDEQLRNALGGTLLVPSSEPCYY